MTTATPVDFVQVTRDYLKFNERDSNSIETQLAYYSDEYIHGLSTWDQAEAQFQWANCLYIKWCVTHDGTSLAEASRHAGESMKISIEHESEMDAARFLRFVDRAGQAQRISEAKESFLAKISSQVHTGNCQIINSAAAFFAREHLQIRGSQLIDSDAVDGQTKEIDLDGGDPNHLVYFFSLHEPGEEDHIGVVGVEKDGDVFFQYLYSDLMLLSAR